MIRFGIFSLITVLLSLGEISTRETEDVASHWSGGISGSYIHIAAFGCSVYVETADIPFLELTRRGDITVSPVRSSPDSLFYTFSGGNGGSVHIRIPVSIVRPVVSIEYEDSFVLIAGVIMDRLNNSGIDGSISIKSSDIDTLITILDRSRADIDANTVVSKFNTFDSRLNLRGRMNNATVICEGGVLTAEVSPDTLLYDLKSAVSDIIFISVCAPTCLRFVTRTEGRKLSFLAAILRCCADS